MTYFLGILVIILGAFMVIRTDKFMEFFGASAWAEANLGGGTYTLYKLLGVVFIIVSMMVMTGLFGEVFLSIFGSIFGIPKQ